MAHGRAGGKLIMPRFPSGKLPLRQQLDELVEITREQALLIDDLLTRPAQTPELIRRSPIPGFWAKITGEASGGGGEYDAWLEQQRTALDAWQDKPGGRTNTSTGQSAWEANETEGLATDDLYVWLVPTVDAGGTPKYVFDAPDAATGGGAGTAIDLADYVVIPHSDLAGTGEYTVIEEDFRGRMIDFMYRECPANHPLIGRSAVTSASRIPLALSEDYEIGSFVMGASVSLFIDADDGHLKARDTITGDPTFDVLFSYWIRATQVLEECFIVPDIDLTFSGVANCPCIELSASSWLPQYTLDGTYQLLAANATYQNYVGNVWYYELELAAGAVGILTNYPDETDCTGTSTDNEDQVLLQVQVDFADVDNPIVTWVRVSSGGDFPTLFQYGGNGWPTNKGTGTATFGASIPNDQWDDAGGDCADSQARTLMTGGTATVEESSP